MRLVLIVLISFVSHLSWATSQNKINQSIIDAELPAKGAIKLWPHEETTDWGARHFKTPTKQLAPAEYPNFDDDLNFENMELAIQRQLDRYRKYPVNGTVRFGATTYNLSHVSKTLNAFLGLAKDAKTCLSQSKLEEDRQVCYEFLNAAIHDGFNVYKPNVISSDPRSDQEEQAFFTAYYTPTLNGNVSRGENDFRFGVYQKPRSDSQRRYTRAQIKFDDVLENKGLNYYYVTDPFKLYLLHVQGGGRIAYEENGKTKYQFLKFIGHNNHSFRFISIYMRDKGYIDNLSIESQRVFLKNNPDKWKEIYSYCPSYVYYQKTDVPPTGSGGVSVTERRSIATDYKLYGYKGMLSYIEAKRPTDDSTEGNVEFKEFSRFMLDQDTGSAIKGKARADIYHGMDLYSEIAAINTQHTGNIYFLMLKK